MRGKARELLLATAAAAATAVLGGCGSSSPRRPSPTKLSPGAVATFLRYTGGHGGPASSQLAPITLGFVNSLGGSISLPWYETEVAHAVATVNDQLGGVRGHPLRLRSCAVGNDEQQGAACARELLADPTVKVVMTAGLATGDAALHRALAGRLPVVGSQPATLSDATAKNSFYLTSGVFGATAMVSYVKRFLHAHTVALLAADDLAVDVQAAGIVRSYLRAYGIHTTQGGFAAGATDYLGAIRAADAQGADAVIALVVVPEQCVGMARSLAAARVTKPVLSFASCIATSVRSTLGDYPKWTYVSFAPNVLGPASSTRQAAEFRAFDQWVSPIAPALPDLLSASNNLSTVLTIDKVLGDVGVARLSTARIAARMRAFKGPVLLGPPKIAFGGVALFNDIGTLASTFSSYAGLGHWSDPTHGAWLVPPNIAPGIYN